MSSDATIQRVCKEFPTHFAKDQETATESKAKYYITRLIGQGATGQVLQAKRVTDDSVFAVKAVDLSGMSEADKTRAQTEVHCLLHCDFFSIVKCHEDLMKKNEAGDPALLALVLDFANAGDLRQEIKNRAKTNRPFREHEAGLLFLQVLMAIHHVHGKNMIHRDIKSANIFLCCNGLVKLGDFGFSKHYSGSVSENVGKTFCGTPYYVAPEIWRRNPYSKKADMFSLGVLLYELLALKRPFDGQNMTEVMEKTLKGQYEPLPSSITEEMRSLVTWLLHDDPAKRPSTSQLLSAPICKLFIDGLVGIVQTQTAFEGDLRRTVREHIQQTRESLYPHLSNRLRPQLESESSLHGNSPGLSTTQDVVKGATLNPQSILCEGTVKKLSSDGQWKKRYLCICSKEPIGKGPMESHNFDLMLAVSRETIGSQCIATAFAELEDVFPVPVKYAGTGAPNVFAIAFKSGVKRLTFQAYSDEDRKTWMANIQKALGFGEE